MLYCPKCRSLSPDGAAKCQNCRSSKLREPGGEDMVLFRRADQYTAERLEERFQAAGIVWEEKPFGKGRTSYFYDSEVMPTDKNLYVRFSDLPAAREIAEAFQKEREQEQSESGGEEEFTEMSRGKRMLVQTVSVLAFLILVMLAVFGADALANWLKGLFGI